MNTRIQRMSAAFFALCMLCAGSAFADGRTDIGLFPNTNTFESYTGPITNFFNGWYASDEDQSAIIASNYTYTTCSKPVPSATHNRVLQLNTQGTTLTNKIDPTSVASQLAYVDSMVKFVASEDKPPVLAFNADPALDIKSAVYIDSNAFLMVYHGLDRGDGLLTNRAVAKIDSLPALNTNEWYRLTIVFDAQGHVAEVADCEMFQVKLNGVPVTNSAAYEDGWLDTFNNTGMLPSTSSAGTWFRSAQKSSNTDAKKITAVAFQGTGYIDDLLVTTQTPDYTYTAPFFTLTLNLGPNGSHNAPGNSIQVASGDTTNITFTADGWYLINALTNNGSAVDAAHDEQSYLLAIGPVSSDRSVDATFYLKQYQVTPDAVANSTRNPSAPWMVNRGASAEAVYTASAWYRVTGLNPGGVGAGNNIATAQVAVVTSATNLSATVTKLADQTYGSTTVPTDWFLGWASGTESLYDNSPLTVEQEYLLNVNPFISETAEFAIKGITVVDPDVNVEVGLQVNSADHTNIIGHLTLLGTPGLPATTWTTNGTPLNGDVFTNGTYTFTFPTNFNTIFKAEIK